MSREHDHVLDPEPPLDRSEITLDDDPDRPEAPIELPVHLTRPAMVHVLGDDLASSTNWDLTTKVEMLVSALETRTRVIIISATEDIYIGKDKSAVSSGNAGAWPASVPFEINTRSRVYARTSQGTSKVSVFIFQVG